MSAHRQHAPKSRVHVVQIPVGAFQENCYLVAESDGQCAAIVDPGSEPDTIIAEVERSGHDVEAIWITHAHVDHIGAIAPLKRKWNVPVYLHPLERPLYRAGGIQARLYGIPYDEPPEPDCPLAEGDILRCGTLQFSVMHVPGHAPGHVVIFGEGIALVGDCLFAGSVGRTDLPFCNPSDLERSLKRITALPSDTVVYPGHGDATTIVEERQSNPFINGTVRIAPAAR